MQGEEVETVAGCWGGGVCQRRALQHKYTKSASSNNNKPEIMKPARASFGPIIGFR